MQQSNTIMPVRKERRCSQFLIFFIICFFLLSCLFLLLPENDKLLSLSFKREFTSKTTAVNCSFLIIRYFVFALNLKNQLSQVSLTLYLFDVKGG